MADTASASILNPNPETNLLNPDWVEFLQQTVVGLNATVSGNSQRRDIDVGFDDAWKFLDALKFSTKYNLLGKLDTPGSVITGLQKNAQASEAIQLGPLLDLLGITVPNTLDIPDEFGKIPVVGGAVERAESLVKQFLEELQRTCLLKVDVEARNYVWLTPGLQFRTDVALTFDLDDAVPKTNLLSKFQDKLTDQVGLKLAQQTGLKFQDIKIFIQRTCLGSKQATGWQIDQEWMLTFNIIIGKENQTEKSFDIWLTQEHIASDTQKSGMRISVTSPHGSDDILLLAGLSKTSIESSLGQLFKKIVFLQLIIDKKIDTVTNKVKFSWNITMALAAGEAKFYLQYDSLQKRFHGGLLRRSFFKSLADKLQPTFRPGEDLDDTYNIEIPVEPWKIGDFLDIFKSLPTALPTVIEEASIDYVLDPTDRPAHETHGPMKKYLLVRFSLVQDQTKGQKQQGVPDPISWKDLKMDFEQTTYESSETTTAKGTTDIELKTPAGLTPEYTAKLNISVDYQDDDSKKRWLVSGTCDNLIGSMLVQFFDPNHRNTMVQIIGKLSIVSLRIIYIYETGSQQSPGAASSFAMKATIAIGDPPPKPQLNLQMLYQYTSNISDPEAVTAGKLIEQEHNKPPDNTGSGQLKPKPPPLPEQLGRPSGVKPSPGQAPTTQWRFECNLYASEAGQTIGTVFRSISNDLGNLLPSFVGDIAFPAANGKDGRSLISLLAVKKDDRVYFSFIVSIHAFTLTYVQLGGASDSDSTKRLFRFSCDSIPTLKDIPLLDQLPQPFDQLQYLYLNGDSDEKDGLRPDDVESLNDVALKDRDSQLKLPYKKIEDLVGNKKNPPSAKNVAIRVGHHFMVLKKGDVIVDHVFSYPKTTTTGGDEMVLFSDNGNLADATLPADNPPSKGAMTKDLGPLKISALTLQVKQRKNKKGKDEPHLMVSMDATFALGPPTEPVITFSLLGFAIGIPLSSARLDKLKDIYKDIVFDLNGLAFGFDKPPVTIAGGFEHQRDGDVEVYMGGVTIGFPPYTFIGLGEYMVLNDYKSVFLYAKLDGPLFTLGVATISGVRFGLGFNSDVRSPSLEEINEFPFINDKAVAGAGNNPMAILKQIMAPPSGRPWVTPKKDAYWLMAGLTMEAFEILTVTAVAKLAFRDSGLIISFYANAVAQMPPHVKERELLIIYVEIGLIAEMNFADGYFMVAASVAPTSFLLVEACRLYGEFSMIYWFEPNAHAGDWVFSIGGYHPKFEAPAWYPKPKRLGISFVTFGISITGEAYFAITPKALMGGALIKATLSVGPVHAWLETQFDALINLHPLHYDVSFRVSVGVECRIDALFIHIHVSVSIGAQLQIYGPDFGGSAYVDFEFFSFTIDFGSSPPAVPPLDLLKFWELVHRPGPKKEPVSAGDPNPVRSYLEYNKSSASVVEDKAAFKFTVEDGSYPAPKQLDPNDKSDPKSTGDGEPWLIKGGTFRFRINTDFAVNHAIITNKPPAQPIDLESTEPIFSKPMRVDKAIESTITVTVRNKTQNNEIVPGWQNHIFDIKAVPVASWGKYDINADPLFKDASGHLLNHDNPTVKLPMGIVLSAPPPSLANSLIPPFDARSYTLFKVMDFRKPVPEGSKPDPGTVPEKDGVNWHIPQVEPQQTNHLPAVLEPVEVAMDSEKRYHAFEAAWGKQASKQEMINLKGDGLLDRLTSLLGWDVDRTLAPPADDELPGAGPGGDALDDSPLAQPVDPASLTWKLKGDFPVRLLARFEDKYLELPRMAVVPS